MMTEIDKAYIAGFLDGDGSIMALIEPHPECRFGYRIRVIVKFSQHRDNKDTLMELKRLIGNGYISRANKLVQEYVIKKKQAVECLLYDLLPYVRVKRKQVRLALELLQQLKQVSTANDFKQVAQLSDALSAVNLKSRSRRRHFSNTIKISPRND